MPAPLLGDSASAEDRLAVLTGGSMISAREFGAIKRLPCCRVVLVESKLASQEVLVFLTVLAYSGRLRPEKVDALSVRLLSALTTRFF
jgi:hypothetical protein